MATKPPTSDCYRTLRYLLIPSVYGCILGILVTKDQTSVDYCEVILPSLSTANNHAGANQIHRYRVDPDEIIPCHKI